MKAAAPMTAWMLALAAVMSVPMARRAGAQPRGPEDDGGPVIIGENRGKYKWWDLQRFRADLEVYGEGHHDRITTKGQPDQVVKDYLIRADTRVEFESYIGHKNLIDLTGNVRLGYEDHQVDSNLPGGDAHESPLVDFYNIEALILGSSAAPFTVYSLRDETRTHRDFSTTLTNTITEHGAVLNIQSDVAPTRLQYFHRDLTQTDNVSIDDESVQDTVSLQSGIRLNDSQRIEIVYTFDHIDERQGDVFDSTYDRHDGAVTHTYSFGAQRQHTLRSYARVYDQSGEFAQSDYRIDENLTLHHSDTLESQYSVIADQQTFAGAEQLSVTGGASVRHTLFESLTTTARVGGRYLSNPDEFESHEILASLLFDYTKKVPFGRLDASLGFAFDQIVSSDRTGNTPVVDEAHTFIDPFPVVLARSNIIASSIVMTNLPRTYTFVQGSDYSVATFSDRTELTRLLLGPNPPANGETVLVSYLIGPEPQNTLTSLGFSTSLRYTVEQGWLTGLSPYAYFFLTDQSISSPDPSAFVIDDVQDIRYGVEYRLGDLSLLAEARNHESSVTPYDEYRAEARYNRRFGRESLLTLEGMSDQVAYRLTGEELLVNRATGRWTQNIGEHFDFSVYLEFRDTDDSTNGHTQAYEQAVSVNWHYGRTRAYATFRNAFIDGQDSTQSGQELSFGVTRSF